MPKTKAMRQGIRAGKIEEVTEETGDKTIRSGGCRVEMQACSYRRPLVLYRGGGYIVAVMASSWVGQKTEDGCGSRVVKAGLWDMLSEEAWMAT